MVALPSGELLVVVNGNGRLEANLGLQSPSLGASASSLPSAEGISGVIDSQNLLKEA